MIQGQFWDVWRHFLNTWSGLNWIYVQKVYYLSEFGKTCL